MTKLSVNINKIATLRNARGGNVPNLLQVATDIQKFGAQGITIHPRPDERHIRYQDARDLKSIVYTEYNIEEFQRNGIRTSIFVDPLLDMIEGAKKTGTDRIELYTEAFAHEYSLGNVKGIDPYVQAAQLANELELGINAGHDLSLDNIQFFKQNIPGLLEVSIGHALISEAIYLGLDNVVNMYLQKLK